ncbi:MAG TPA: ATP-binding protein [Saprospiraceae bacterium]|nr:ATP-binding protein [Saprospiraceae bacterium]
MQYLGRTVLLILITTLCCSITRSQNTYLPIFHRFEAKNGLANNVVRHVFQDKEGFIWIATHTGLDRYCGHGFKHWTLGQILMDGFILESMGQDDEGWLWLKGYDGYNTWKIIFLNPISEQIQTVDQRFPEGIPLVLKYFAPGRWPTTFHTDLNIKNHSGKMFFGAVSKPVRLISYFSKEGFKSYPVDEVGQLVLKSVASDGTIWGAEHGQLIHLDSTGHILNKYPNAGFNSIYWVREVHNEMYYFAYNYPPQKEAREQIFKIGSDGQRIEISYPHCKEADGGFIYYPRLDVFLSQEENGNSRDIHIISTTDGHTIQTIKDQSWSSSRPCMIDRNGQIWFYSNLGLSMLDLKLNKFRTYLSTPPDDIKSNHSSMRGIALMGDSIIAGIELAGLKAIDRVSGLAKEKIGKVFPNDVLSYWARAIYQEDENILWFGSDTDLYKYDNRDHTIRKLVDGDIEKEVQGYWSITKDDAGTIWCSIRKGLCYLTESSEGDSLTNTGIKEFVDHNIYDMQPAEQHHLWLCSDNGLFLFNTQSKEIIGKYNYEMTDEHFLPAMNFRHLCKDTGSVMWLATSEGLIKWNPKNRESVIYNINDGFSDANLYAVYKDKFEHLWMSSDKGIIQFDPATCEVRNYLPSDGIAQNEFNRISHYQDKKGRIYFGGLNGLTTFDPKNFYSSTPLPPPKLLLEGFYQFVGKENKLMDRSGKLRTTHTITMQPDDSFFQVDLGLLVFEDQNVIRYESMIDGIDKDWRLTKDATVTQGRLPYGTHFMRIRALHPSGAWSNVLEVKIIMVRPFYQSTWFIISMLALLGALFPLNARIQNRRLIKRQKTLEKEILQATEMIRIDKHTIEQQTNELLHLDKLKSQFFANISHELRTPLTLMLGPISSVLKRNALQASDHELLETAHNNGGSLLKLISSILNLSKLESGHLQVQEQPVHLYSFFQRVLASFATYAQISDLQFDFRYEADHDLTLMFDKDKLEIILNNLLSNAIKFTPPGGRITVVFEDLKEDVCISIVDSGRGIHAEDLPHIFDRYYQSQKKSSGTTMGTGIGLALTHQYVDVMKGEISVDSHVGSGTTFKVLFPRKTEIDSSEKDESVGNALTITENAGHLSWSIYSDDVVQSKKTLEQAVDDSGIQILIVEDHPDLRRYLSSVISSSFTVHTAENGLDAWENKLPFHQYHLVLTDVLMPYMDGFELLEKIKSDDRFRHLPVVMLTALSDIQDRLKALRIGVDDYMLKPFVEEELIARIENLLRHRSMRSQYASIEVSTKEEELEVEETELTDLISADDQDWLEMLEANVINFLSDNRFNMDFIAGKMDISRRQMQRRLKRITGLTPNEYVMEIRLHRARTLLEQNTVSSIKQVADSVGYADTTHFSKVFRNRFGKSPSSYLSN